MAAAAALLQGMQASGLKPHASRARTNIKGIVDATDKSPPGHIA